MFAEGDRELCELTLAIDDRLPRVLPALVVIAALARPRGILLQAVPVHVAVGVDPGQGALDVRTHRLETFPVAPPAPRARGRQDVERRRVVRAVVRRMRNQMQRGELALAELVQ